MAQPRVASTLIGARTPAQLADNLTAADLTLNAEQMTRLTEASAPVPSFSASLASPAIRRMVFGGHYVRGWGGVGGTASH